MREFIKREFAVVYKSGIYDLLERLNLSHQKAHSDYQNASRQEQLQFLEDFKQVLLNSDQKNATLSFDKFQFRTNRPLSMAGRKETLARVSKLMKKTSVYQWTLNR